MKKGLKSLAILFTVFSALSINSCYNLFNSTVCAKKVGIENFDLSLYKTTGWDIEGVACGEKIYLKCIHKETGTMAICDLSKNKGIKNIIACSWPPLDDTGIGHCYEHLIMSEVLKVLLKKYGIIGPKEANGETVEHGFYFFLDDDLFNLENLGIIFDELLNPTFLKDNGEAFRREIFSYKNGINTGRAHHEVANNSKDKSIIDRLKERRLREYDHGGIPGPMSKLTEDDLKKYHEKIIGNGNLYCMFAIGSDPKNIQNTLRFIGQKLNRFKKYRNKKCGNKGKGYEYKLKVDAKENPLYKKRDWYGDSKIFKETDNTGCRVGYDYVSKICFNVEDKSLDEKDALTLNGYALHQWSSFTINLTTGARTDLEDIIKKLGYSFVRIDSSEVIKGKLYVYLYGDKEELFEESVLRQNVKKILEEKNKYLVEKILPKYRDEICCINALIDRGNVGRVVTDDIYRKNYKMDDLIFYAFTKYGDPFSDKVFEIGKTSNPKIKAIRDKEYKENGYSNKKEMFIRKLQEGLLSNLAKSNIEYIDVFKKDVGKSILAETENLYKSVDFKISGYNDDKNCFRFVEFILLDNLLNHEIDKKGLSYRSLYSAPYVGGKAMCWANKDSFESLQKYLNSDGKDGAKAKLKEFKINRQYFGNLLNSYVNHLVVESGRVSSLINLLENYKNQLGTYRSYGCDVANKQQIFADIENEIDNIDLVFNNKDIYKEHLEKSEKFKDFYQNWADEDCYDKDENKAQELKERKKNAFYNFFEKYSQYYINIFTTYLTDLKDRIQNASNIKYEDVTSCLEKTIGCSGIDVEADNRYRLITKDAQDLLNRHFNGRSNISKNGNKNVIIMVE